MAAESLKLGSAVTRDGNGLNARGGRFLCADSTAGCARESNHGDDSTDSFAGRQSVPAEEMGRLKKMHDWGKLFWTQSVFGTIILGGGSSERAMWRLQDPMADLALSLLILVVLTVIAVFVIVKVRRRVREEDPSGIELLTKFRDVHAQGGLSDAEFRTIKTRLADRVVEGQKEKEQKS